MGETEDEVEITLTKRQLEILIEWGKVATLSEISEEEEELIERLTANLDPR